MDDYFKDVPFDDQNRNLFAFAAYDAGPSKIKSLRREAEAEKLDPNLWFNMSSGWQRPGWGKNQCNTFATSTNITSLIS